MGLTGPTRHMGYDRARWCTVKLIGTPRCPFDVSYLWSGRSFGDDVSYHGWHGSKVLDQGLHLAGFIDRDMIGQSASHGCSTETWSSPPPHRVARQRLGCPLRLVGLLHRDLVSRCKHPTSWFCDSRRIFKELRLKCHLIHVSLLWNYVLKNK